MPKIKSESKGKNYTVKVDLNFPTEMILDAGTVNAAGLMLIRKSIEFMSKGASPVDGKRFEKYKDVEKYPKNVRKSYPDKKNTPVNLRLTGNLYESFGFKKSSSKGFLFGILNPKGNVLDYASVHNEGKRSDIPQRKYLPTGKGETFNKTIMLELRRVIVDRIKALIKK